MTTTCVAHVAEVLGDRDAGVDAGLARHHRHVRGVGDDDRALGAAAPPVRGSSSSRELGDDVGHLVAALAAADVDDHVGVAPLGDLLQQHGLAGAEAARDGGAAAPGDRVQQVEDPLAGVQRCGDVDAFAVRPRPAYRPGLGERHLRAGDRRDHRVGSVTTRRRHLLHRARDPRRYQHPQRDATRAGHGAELGAGRHPDAGGHRGGELPAAAVVVLMRRPREQPVADLRQRAQQAVEDPAEQTGAQPGRERGPRGTTPAPGARPPVSS